MRRLHCMISAFIIGCMAVVAQTVVSGSVVSKSEEAIAGCTVFFIQADTVAGGVATDSKGKFLLKGLKPEIGRASCRERV